MFLRRYTRTEDGKTHSYSSLVEWHLPGHKVLADLQLAR